MSDRVSQIILLCEDDLQEQLVRFYLEQCRVSTRRQHLRILNASRLVHGGNVGWVRSTFPSELTACRKRHSAKASTLLIVVADADSFTVAERRGHFQAESPFGAHDPVVSVIPRRHIETWIWGACGKAVNETENYKHPTPTKSEVRRASFLVYALAHDANEPRDGCVPSLLESIPDWQRIG